MNLNTIVIKHLLDIKYYSNYFNVINEINKSNRLISKLLNIVKLLYDKYNKSNYSVDDLEVLFHTSYPALQKDEADYYAKFFEGIRAVDVDETIAEGLFKKYREQALAEEIALVAVQVAQGKKSFDDLTIIVKDSEQGVEEEPEELTTTSIKEIHSAKQNEKGLRWRLGTLNRSIGSLRKGNFGFIFARPEAGKTTFLASEVTCMADQTDGNILWVNNEQPGPDVIWRCYSALLGQGSEYLGANLDLAEQRWNESIGDRLKFIDNPGATKAQIDALCKKYNPALIVFDQLDKVHGFDAERYDLLMKAKYQWARELSKRYGPVIGVCQAGGTAENKRYLEMNDIDSSHTAKQGEADWILGIGKVNDAGYESIRYINISKNKLPGDEDTDPKLRHAKAEVIINEHTARYEDKIRW